jgi:hypothetical protein
MQSSAPPPRLIDHHVKYHLYTTLQKCHQTRLKYHTVALNVIVATVFFGIIGWILYRRYKTRPTDEEVRERMARDQEYIVSKIRFYQEENHRMAEKTRQQATAITDLPMPEASGLAYQNIR